MIKVYGLKISYFTGKLEGYLRYKEIPYNFHSLTMKEFSELLPEKTGALQMPAVKLEDERWMTDSSPIIDWFETQYQANPILPDDPVQAFVCKLIEDYADEWQWRPAMHYRWSYPETSRLLSTILTNTIGRESKVPEWLFRQQVEKRQYKNFVQNDGVDEDTREHVEQSYYRLLNFMRDVLKTRPFVFGNKPTLADFGLFGPLFRHYSMDPAPAKIMREDYPEVMEWVYRVWNARGSKISGKLVSGIPDDVAKFIQEIAETHLEALCANADAYANGKKLHDPIIQGVQYRAVPTSRYRVWCLEHLQRQRMLVAETSRKKLDALLDKYSALEPMTRITDLKSGYNESENLPFGKSISVFETVK